MALRLRPHTVTVKAISESGDGASTVLGSEFATTQSVKCQITPEKASVLFEKWGIDGIARPHLLLCNVSDGALFKTGDELEKTDGRVFVVKAAPQIWDAETITSCAAVPLDEVTM